MEALKKKGHMLRTWGGDASVDGTIKEWQKIREIMLSQQQMFEHQVTEQFFRPTEKCTVFFLTFF